MRDDANDWMNDPDRQEAVEAALAEAGVEPEELDLDDRWLGGPDVRARDEVIASAEDLPLFESMLDNSDDGWERPSDRSASNGRPNT